jgi:hypothetical protein
MVNVQKHNICINVAYHRHKILDLTYFSHIILDTRGADSDRQICLFFCMSMSSSLSVPRFNTQNPSKYVTVHNSNSTPHHGIQMMCSFLTAPENTSHRME